MPGGRRTVMEAPQARDHTSSKSQCWRLGGCAPVTFSFIFLVIPHSLFPGWGVGEYWGRVEFIPLYVSLGLALSPSQGHQLITVLKLPLRTVVPSLYSHHGLGFRFLRLCGLSLVSPAVCSRKPFFPGPYFSHSGCSFQGP